MSQQSYGGRATAKNPVSVGNARSLPPLLLQALDGSLAGASHREIAEALIGKLRVQDDWKDPRDHLRDRIRRAIRRGHALMNGGYRAFVA
ncbi:DUF2285 domain-containing protein [Mesorhizobium sp. LNHC209A00]|uniref:DNA -binding domain-containing protein n=1 Tax=Mesorhizobium TaxID=68287 RepID=UPI0003D05E68|nr:DUF2285 domain-containing protein [Mesorhizobium sp. LNHC209A00]ESY91657.1 hypothetical protein X738_28745 [Mesorhizobium sp. LNHC209A00]